VADRPGSRSFRSYRPTPLMLGSLALHAAGAMALAGDPPRWRSVAGLLLANHVALAAVSLWPRSQALGPNLVRLPASAAQPGEIALTFDDGPDPRVTPRVLDLLDQAGMKATFFVVGRRVRPYPCLTAEIARRGHRVENHTDTHPHLFACYPVRLLRREVERAQDAVTAATGRPPRLFRAPAGLRNPFLDWVLHRAGLHLVAWTRRGFDAVENNPKAIARRLLDGLLPGDILLLHDGRATHPPRGNPVVLESLPRVLDGLTARGLRSVLIPDP
jgi:peptidoglycan/xylan/chitin deacetylase (PgdA/CDA1 family)